MKKRDLSITIITIILTLFWGGTILVSANESNTLNSKGVIAFDSNKDGDLADAEDVVIDSADFTTLNNKITVNATQVKSIERDVEQLNCRLSA